MKYIGTSLPLFLILGILSSCASEPTQFRWVSPDVYSPDSLQSRDLRDDWAKRITVLPIELHGEFSDEEFRRTASVIHNVASDTETMSDETKKALSAQQRMVLYMGEVSIPVRQDFCSLNKSFRNFSVKDSGLTLRAAVCDGQRLICYARDSGSPNNSQSGNIAERVTHLKQSLIAALYPAPTLKQARDIGPAAGW